MTGVCAWWVYVPFSVFVVHVNSETKGFDNALKQQISRASVGTGPATLSVVRGSALARDTGQATKPPFYGVLEPFAVVLGDGLEAVFAQKCV